MEIGPIVRSLLRRKSVSALLVLEVAVGMVVMVHNFVLGRYYSNLAYAPSGLDDESLVYVTRRFGAAGRSEAAARAQVAADVARLSTTDGVAAAAAVDELPFPEQGTFSTVLTGDAAAAGPIPGWAVRATDGVTEALGLRIREGRRFSRGETGAAIISRRLAERLYPGGGAVGHRIAAEGLPPARVVGVADEFRVRMSFAPDSNSVALLSDLPVTEREARYVVRSGPGRRDAALPGIRAGLSAVTPADADDTVTVAKFDGLSTRFHRIARGATIVIAWMSLMVVGVALAGALAVASFSVAERTRQIGVRRALGATRGGIIRYFLLENAVVTTVGIAAGVVLALPINSLLRRLLPPLGVTELDVALSMALFWAAGLASALVPALRAARIPPTAATRIV